MTNYVLFPTTRTFIRGMKAAEAAGIPHTVMAVPTHITHECGMCLRMTNNAEVLHTLGSLFTREGIKYQIITE